MLEQKIKLRKSIEDGEDKIKVSNNYNEFIKAYNKLKNPSRKHIQAYVLMTDYYIKYLNSNDSE